jgi:FkbM family methyltransferase
MKELINAILRSIRVLRKIGSLHVQKDVKDKIRDAYLRTILLKRYDWKNDVVRMAGYEVKFCTYESFAYLFNEIFIDQEYFFVTENTKPFIIDCGSNIGMSILYFKMIYPSSIILAFEPDSEAFLCLERNVTANRLHSVDAHRNALSRTEGCIDFYYDQDNRGSLGMSIIRARMPRHKQVVEAVRLSRFIEREVDFLKLDVEGAELDIIEELCSEGKLGYIKQMVIEFHHHIVPGADELSKILRLLEDAGFGYQIQSDLERPFRAQQFQDVLIFAYRKDHTT